MITKKQTTLCGCNKCGYQWTPKEDKPPKVCPRCKSYKWDKSNKKE